MATRRMNDLFAFFFIVILVYIFYESFMSVRNPEYSPQMYEFSVSYNAAYS